MNETLAGLEAGATAGESLEALTSRAEALLASPEGVAAEAPSALARAQAAWTAIEQLTSQAWQHFPEMHASGAHGAEPDPRAIQLFATLTYVQKAGFYSAAELVERATAGEAPGRWAAREAVRLAAFLACLRRAIDGLDDGSTTHIQYPEAVAGLARRFATMRLG